MAQTKARLPWVDVARGYGILAIILSHVLTGHPVSKWLFTFHVPLFFFLSGYLFRDGKAFSGFFKGKLRHLVLPYFSLGLCVVFAEALLQAGPEPFWSRAGSLFLGLVVQRRQWSLWFLPALLLTELAGFWVIRLLRRRWCLALAGIALGALGIGYRALGGPVLPWCLDAVLPMLPFFLAGYLIKTSGRDWEALAKSPKGVLAFFLLGAGNLAFGAPAILGLLPQLDVFSGSYGFPLLSYPGALCGSLCVVLVAIWWPARALEYLGKNSMLYFAWHQTPVLTAILLFFPMLGIPVSGFSSGAAMLGEKGLEVLVILTLLTGANALLSRSRLKWMLGK